MTVGLRRSSGTLAVHRGLGSTCTACSGTAWSTLVGGGAPSTTAVPVVRVQRRFRAIVLSSVRGLRRTWELMLLLLLLLGGRVLLLLLLHHQLLLLLHKLHLKRLLLLRRHERLRIRAMGLKSQLLLLEHHLLQKRDCMSLAGYGFFTRRIKNVRRKVFT